MATQLVGAGVSAIGSLVGANKQEKAIQTASGVQTSAATKNAALEAGATQAANTNTASNLASTTANEKPYQTAGGVALGQLAAGTATGGEFNSTPTATQVLAEDPGYAFQLQQGQQALERSEAAGGSVGSGGALKAGIAYSQNYADSAYNNAYSQFMNTRASNYSNLENIANYGQNANTTLANANTAESGQIANTTLAGTAAQTNDLGEAANATAAGDIGVANAQASALSSLGGIGQAASNGISSLTSGSGYGSGTALAPGEESDWENGGGSGYASGSGGGAYGGGSSYG